MPVLGLAYLMLVRAAVLPARPGMVWALAVLPVLAGAVALRRGAYGALAIAILEIAALVPLHGLVTLIRAWRLEGG